jgi:iron complex outermembrane recepter protein
MPHDGTLQGRDGEMVRARLLRSVAALAVVIGASPAYAQQSAAPEQQADDAATQSDVIVTGIRASVDQSLRAKRTADRVIDVISAEDIGKLPDQNVAEVLQRITGVQITRAEGQGAGFTIRGINLNRLEINGQNYIGAATDGTARLSDINPEIFSAIEVIKSPGADQIEGALGGTVNLRTKRPLELKPLVLAARAEGSYSDQADDFGGRASGLISFRNDAGTFGALFSAAYYKVANEVNAYTTQGWTRTNAIDGNGDGLADPGLFRPTRFTFQNNYVDNERWTLNGALQWKPADSLTLTLDGTYVHLFAYRLQQAQQNITTDAITGARADAQGTIYQGTFTNLTYRPVPFDNNSYSENYNVAGAAEYERGPLAVKASALYGKGSFEQRGYSPLPTQRAGRQVRGTFDLNDGTRVPNLTFTTVPNFDLLDPSQFILATLSDRIDYTDNDGWDARIDADYKLDGFIRSIEIGARVEQLNITASRRQQTLSAAQLLAGKPSIDRNGNGVIDLTEIEGINLVGLASGGFLKTERADFPRNWLAGTVDIDASRSNLGVGFPPLQLAGSAGVDQRTWAGYAKLNFGTPVGGMNLTGNVGIRYVDTTREAQGFAQAGAIVSPVNVTRKFTNWLPSANLLLEITPRLQLRAAAAKVIARPPLLQVAPAFTINTVSLSASAGNPNLRPFAATQYDATIEWYFAPSSILSAAVFYKNVNSFTVTSTTPETIPGFESFGTFQVSRPANGTDGTIKGFEVSYEHALTFLPGLLSGLGIAANYTYSDSETPIAESLNPNRRLPLPGLSKHSYNAAVYYEKGPFSGRLAYNHRSSFVAATQAATLGGDLFTKGYGQLDASASLAVRDNVKLNLNVINITQNEEVNYAGVSRRVNDFAYQDTRWFLGVSAAF